MADPLTPEEWYRLMISVRNHAGGDLADQIGAQVSQLRQERDEAVGVCQAFSDFGNDPSEPVEKWQKAFVLLGEWEDSRG